MFLGFGMAVPPDWPLQSHQPDMIKKERRPVKRGDALELHKTYDAYPPQN